MSMRQVRTLIRGDETLTQKLDGAATLRDKGAAPKPSAPRSPSPSPALEPPPPSPLPAGAEVEVRDNRPGYFGSWYEATVVSFDPAPIRRRHTRGRPRQARYTIAYSHLTMDDGATALVDRVAVADVRPRPPAPSAPPRFRRHDIVEAFDKDGWWSGIVVVGNDDAAADSAVTVAFPITREVIVFAPHRIRPRRDHVGGSEWVPSLDVITARAKGALEVYQYGVREKVEAWKKHEVYGYSWFAATVAKAVDRCSYVVEYSDLEEKGEEGSVAKKATEYLYWEYIRPWSIDHPVWESESQLVPGTEVEAYCDGAWSPGVVHGVVREGEYEIRVNCGEAEVMVTMVVELLRPHYWWDGNRWECDKVESHKTNALQRSASGKRRSSHVEVALGDDEQSHAPEYSGNKKSRKELQQQEAILTGGPERVPISEMDNNLSASHEPPANNQILNPCSPLPENKRDKTHPMQELQGKKDASKDVHIQLKENINSYIKETDCDLSASLECQTTSALATIQASTGTNSSSDMNLYAQLKMRKDFEGPEAPRSSVDVTSAVQKGGREKTAESTKQSSLALGVTELFQTQQQQLNRTSENTLNVNQVTIQKLAPQVSLGSKLGLQSAESSQGITEKNILGSCSVTRNSMPSQLAISEFSSHQHIFGTKKAPLWTIVRTMDVVKKSTFDRLVKDIMKSTITDSMASLEPKLSTLRRLEEHGFNVQSLQNCLVSLVQIKADNIRHVEEKDKLKAQVLEKKTCLSGIDLSLAENRKAVAELEKKLCELRKEGQKIAKEKEREDEELSRLGAANSNVEEACGDDEQQFRSVLAELQRKHHLT